MGDKTGIEWTDATWNPVTGCTKVSPGCDNCYAETFSERFRGTPGHYFEGGFDLQLRPDKLDQPLRWKKPRRIFVNSMSDLFHAEVPDQFIAKVWATMMLAPQHTFQVLTKRPTRMRALLTSSVFALMVRLERDALLGLPTPSFATPSYEVPPNVWLGVSTENQKWADIRVPALLDTPAAVRFISAEPLLGPIDLFANSSIDRDPGLDWVIAGGESGHAARPMHPAWVRVLRDECTEAGIAFLFKQWGEFTQIDRREARIGDVWVTGEEPPQSIPWRPDTKGAEAHRWGPHRDEIMRRTGKKTSGRELDGRTWDDYPNCSQ